MCAVGYISTRGIFSGRTELNKVSGTGIGFVANHTGVFGRAFFLFFFFVSLLLSSLLWSQVSSHLPPGTCLQFISRIGLSIPTARRLSSNVNNSRFRAFRESIGAQEKVPTNLYEYALGGTRTHEIDL